MKRFLVFLIALVIVGLNNSAYSATFDGQERNFNEDDPVPAIVIEEEVEADCAEGKEGRGRGRGRCGRCGRGRQSCGAVDGPTHRGAD